MPLLFIVAIVIYKFTYFHSLLNLYYIYILEFEEFQQYIPGAVRFTPDLKTLKRVLDGGVAIIDQWICAHSR